MVAQLPSGWQNPNSVTVNSLSTKSVHSMYSSATISLNSQYNTTAFHIVLPKLRGVPTSIRQNIDSAEQLCVKEFLKVPTK